MRSSEWVSKACRLGGNPRALLKWITSCLVRELSTRDEASAARTAAALTSQLKEMEVRCCAVCQHIWNAAQV